MKASSADGEHNWVDIGSVEELSKTPVQQVMVGGTRVALSFQMCIRDSLDLDCDDLCNRDSSRFSFGSCGAALDRDSLRYPATRVLSMRVASWVW